MLEGACLSFVMTDITHDVCSRFEALYVPITQHQHLRILQSDRTVLEALLCLAVPGSVKAADQRQNITECLDTHAHALFDLPHSLAPAALHADYA
jgi:hypothetical protein